MADQPHIDSIRTISALRVALSGVAEAAARDSRLITAERAGQAKLLAAKDLRQLRDGDAALAADLSRVTATLAGQDKVSTLWQKRLAEATKAWEVSLAEFAKLHPEAS